MLLWANSHAAWLSGFIAIACYLLGEALERLVAGDQPAAGGGSSVAMSSTKGVSNSGS